MSRSNTVRVSLPAGFEVPLYFWSDSADVEQTIVCTSGEAYLLHGSIPLVRNKGYHVKSQTYSYAKGGSSYEGDINTTTSSGDSVSETIAEVTGLMRWANSGLVTDWEKLYADRRVALSAASGLTSVDVAKPVIIIVTSGVADGCELLVTGCATGVEFQEPRQADNPLASIFSSIGYYRQRCVDNVLRQEGFLSEGGGEAAATVPPTQSGAPTSGPIVAVIGGRGSGKTALANQLVHSCQLGCVSRVKAGLDDIPVQAALLSADVACGVDGDLLPGCISARFSCLPGSSQPLSYFYGATRVESHNVNRYLDVCAYASQSLEMLRLSRKDIRLGGTIVDTPAITDGPSYRAVTGLLDLIRPTHIIVLSAHTTRHNAQDDEEFSSQGILDKLRRDVLGIQMGSVQLFTYKQRYPNFNKDVPQTITSTIAKPSCGFDSYFSGRALEGGGRPLGVSFTVGLRMPLAASLQVVRLADLMMLDALTFEKIQPDSTVEVKEGAAFTQKKKGDMEEEDGAVVVARRRLAPGMVAAVPFPCPLDTLTATNVAGYVAIKEIGEEIVILVCPAPGPLPTKVLLVSSFNSPITISDSVTAALSW